jgi:hypothetical protein
MEHSCKVSNCLTLLSNVAFGRAQSADKSEFKIPYYLARLMQTILAFVSQISDSKPWPPVISRAVTSYFHNISKCLCCKPFPSLETNFFLSSSVNSTISFAHCCCSVLQAPISRLHSSKNKYHNKLANDKPSLVSYVITSSDHVDSKGF